MPLYPGGGYPGEHPPVEFEQLTFTAGEITKTADLTVTAGNRVMPGWDWGVAKAKRNAAVGRYGSLPLGPTSYEDRTIVFSIEHSTGGTRGTSEAFVQSWARFVGLVSEVEDATLRCDTALGIPVWFDLVEGELEVLNRGDVMWSSGRGQIKLTLKARGVGRGAPQVIPSTFAVPTAGDDAGLPIWASAAFIPGDVPPLVSIEATFAEKHRGMVVQSLDGQGTMWSTANWEEAGVGGEVAAPSGAVNSTVHLAQIEATPGVVQPLVRFGDLSSAGTLEVDAHVLARYVEGTDVTPTRELVLVLMDGAREVARRPIVSHEDGDWQLIRFGSHRFTGGIASLGVEANGARVPLVNRDELTLDYVSTQPVTASARVAAPQLNAGAAVMGALAPTDLSTLDGSAGEMGGTWDAAGFVRDSAEGVYENTGSGGVQTAYVGTRSLPAAVTARVKFGDPGTTNSCTVGLAAVSGGDAVWLSQNSQALGGIVTIVFSGGGSLIVEDWPFELDEWFDVRITIDEGGRWKVEAASPGRPLEKNVLGEGTYAGGWSGAWQGGVRTNSPNAGVVQLSSVSVHDVPDAVSTLKWETAPEPGAPVPFLVEGNLPRIVNGAEQRISVRGVGDHTDAGTDHAPTSVTVTAVPLFLQVPA